VGRMGRLPEGETGEESSTSCPINQLILLYNYNLLVSLFYSPFPSLAPSPEVSQTSQHTICMTE
jgi:hypothetical protein